MLRNEATSQLLETCVSNSPRPFLAPALKWPLPLLPLPRGWGGLPPPVPFCGTHISPSAERSSRLLSGRPLQCQLPDLHQLFLPLLPQTRRIRAVIQYDCKCLSRQKKKVQSGCLYSALLLMWFASTLPKGLGFSSEWGLLQLKIQAGWRDEVGQSMGNIQEKWLCSSPRLGLILPPTDQKCSLLGMKPLTAERLQAPGKQPAPKALNTSGLGSALRLKVQRWRISKRFRNVSGKRQSRGQGGWWQRTVWREKSQMRKVGLDGARLHSLNFSFNWNELRMVNLLWKY